MRSIHALAAAAMLATAAAAVPAQAEDSNWDSIRAALFAGKELQDGSAVIAFDAPKRAQDAAVVPVTIKALQPQTPDHYIKTVHLIIDNNPAPVAGVFHLHPETGDATLATRVRVNDYTNLHVVAETSDGALYVVDRFVKASGGCSAPASKDAEAQMARLGQMKLKPLAAFAAGQPNQVQLLISHPNYSGLQIDQVTRNWIPPDYVRSVRVSYAGKPVMEVEGDISFSEDPSLTFSFVPQEPGTMAVAVDDSKGRHFDKSFDLGSGS